MIFPPILMEQTMNDMGDGEKQLKSTKQNNSTVSKSKTKPSNICRGLRFSWMLLLLDTTVFCHAVIQSLLTCANKSDHLISLSTLITFNFYNHQQNQVLSFLQQLWQVLFPTLSMCSIFNQQIWALQTLKPKTFLDFT